MWTDERIADEIDDACVRDGKEIYLRTVTLESRLNECEATIYRMSDDNEELQTTNEQLLAQLTKFETVNEWLAARCAILLVGHDNDEQRIESLTTSHKEIVRNEARQRSAELEAALDVRGTGTMAILKKRNEQLANLADRFVALRREKEELRLQLTAALATIDQAVSAYQISENQRLDAIPEATGHDYAEGCAP